MKKTFVQRELFATPDDPRHAQKIVDEELGEGFTVDYLILPKNVGVIGDEGVRGHSLLITGETENPSYYLAENSELLGRLSIRLCNETSAATRVLFEITPLPKP